MIRDAVICVPARNEARRLPVLLEALAAQEAPGPIKVALCINNSNDASATVASRAARSAGGRLEVRTAIRTFSPELAHVGSARRAAMDLGGEWLGKDSGLLISTDADCRPPPSWLAANLAHADAAVQAGKQRIIGGKIELDSREKDKWPELFKMREGFDAYWTRVRELEDAVDPVPWDPPPRHGDHTGASLALSVGLYRAAGGVPIMKTGEDRALVSAAIAAGGELVHPIDVWTRTSARPIGRAKDGMATDMRRWLAAGAGSARPQVPAYWRWHGRALWRRSLRPVLGPDLLARAEAALPPMPSEMPLPEGLLQ